MLSGVRALTSTEIENFTLLSNKVFSIDSRSQIERTIVEVVNGQPFPFRFQIILISLSIEFLSVLLFFRTPLHLTLAERNRLFEWSTWIPLFKSLKKLCRTFGFLSYFDSLGQAQ